MPVYAYTARTKEGEVKHGTLEASSEAAAKAWMYNERLLLVGLKEKKPSLLKREIRVPFLKGRVKAKELLAFTRQLAAMIEAGLPLLTALGTLRKEERNPYFAKILSDIIAEVEGGASLHNALGAHPKVFDEVYVGTVEAGESSGILGRVLGRLATHIENAIAIKRRIRGAIVYPSVLAVLSFGVILLFLLWVIPNFEATFKDFVTILPPTTKFMLGASHALRDHAFISAAVLVWLVVMAYALMKVPRIKRAWHRLALKLPAIGPVAHKSGLARFADTFGTLLVCGLPVMRCFETSSRAIPNLALKDAILGVAESVRQGESIAASMGKDPHFPGMVVQMVAAGEMSGTLDQMLQKINVYYESETESAIETMLSLLEPALLLGMGGIIGFILISIYMPLFKVGELVSQIQG